MYFNLPKVTMLTLKGLLLILSDETKSDFVKSPIPLIQKLVCAFCAQNTLIGFDLVKCRKRDSDVNIENHQYLW